MKGQGKIGVLAEKRRNDECCLWRSCQSGQCEVWDVTDIWNSLTDEEQLSYDCTIMKDMVLELGEAEYNTLLVEEKHDVDLFLWTGCCMHKEQNTFKAGNARMMEW